MCSILGIINFNGLTDTDLKHFRRMFLRAEERGTDASGVATQNLSFLKWDKATSLVKKTAEFNSFLLQARGKKWIIGHARRVTRGDPSQMINNHPVSVEKSKYLLIHNGVVGSHSIVSPERRTDTFIIAKAIQQSWIENDLFSTVKNSYALFYGAAAIAVIDPYEIVLARRWNPIIRGRTSTGAIVFGSTKEIVKGGTSYVKDLHAIPEDKIIGYYANGKARSGKLKVVARPSYFNTDWRTQSESYQQSEPRQTSIDRFLASTGYTPLGPLKKKKGKGKGWHKQKGRHKKAAILGHIRKKSKRRRLQ